MSPQHDRVTNPLPKPPSLRTSTTRSVAEESLATFERQRSAERRSLRLSLGVAVAFHLVLFAITFPSLQRADAAEPEPRKVFVVEPIRFEPPPPEEEPRIPKPRSRKQPVPDPTPDEPEPLQTVEPETFELPDVVDLDVAVPEAPPPPEPEEPRWVSGDVRKPERISWSPPAYTESARKVRVQGVVRLQAVIDEHGNVTEVEVLQGLPMGLTENAVEAVRDWKFSPATLHGRPVAVRYALSVRFELR